MQFIANFSFIYLIIWWVVLMTILSKGHEIEENPTKGHASGAPKNPQIGKKFLLTSIITFVISCITMIILRIFNISF